MLENYFNNKNIKCTIKEEQTSYFTTYIIQLQNITDLKKFNKSMQNELIYLLHDNSLQLIIDEDIKIVTKKKNKEYNDQFLTYIVQDDDIHVNVGNDTNNQQIFINMKSNPHWLVSGSTGSGKSVFMNNCINYILKNYHYCVHTCFIDLKKVEFSTYKKLYTNLFGVATEYDQAINILNNLINIMNERYRTLEEKSYKNIQEHNKNELSKMKYIFCFIDELAELMLYNKKEVTNLLCRLLQLGRAAGIYLIVATQRPSTDIINGLLKNNFTTKISFKVSNMFDSKTAINQAGAEKLAGCGDGLLLKNGDFNLTRFQAYNISPETQRSIIEQLNVKEEVKYQGIFKNLLNDLRKCFK